MHSKNEFRIQALARRRALTGSERKRYSDEILRKLRAYLNADPELRHAPRLIYRARNDEADTRALFEAETLRHHKTYAPCTQTSGDMHWRRIIPETRWQSGAFGIQEPVGGEAWEASREAAVLICPLVGFDRNGNRIGLGKGCFDRWLAGHRRHILRIIGLAFACQECPPIACEAHDVALDTVITEEEIISCRKC